MSYYNGIVGMLSDLATFTDVVISQLYLSAWALIMHANNHLSMASVCAPILLHVYTYTASVGMSTRHNADIYVY